ncbi:tRNA pseudouridine synthase 1 [Ricinus communis]|uniref:tRNA pseudouridine synthase 1 n=1 Tax=Ricinus communis TaxID=3988 RepID=UPI0007726CF0|nr:tRNA pseudouridine synthase 1 [Ricinus communis]|eukprot:XP_015578294.1 tRNA pseudouridine synthase 1 [Ricinus communis]
MENSNLKITSSPPQQEPEHKRPRMSTTTSDEEEIATTASGDETATDKKQRYKRRKIAIFFAYCGVGYQGMQKNPGTKTIEGELEEALFHFDAVPEQDRGCPKRYDWARTDKGVSAVGQVISGRFHIDPPGLVGRLNSILPSHIRIFGYKRVTASFNAKKLSFNENEKEKKNGRNRNRLQPLETPAYIKVN